MHANDASRIIGVIDNRVRKLTGSEAGVETTWGEVVGISADGRLASAYLYGETEFASENFRIPGTLAVSVGDRVKVAWDKRGDRWVAEVANLSAAKKIEIDPNTGTIKVGDGTARPAILIADSSGAVVGVHDHDADYSDIAHNHDADYEAAGAVTTHEAAGDPHPGYAADGHNHDATYVPLAFGKIRYTRTGTTGGQTISNNTETVAVYPEVVRDDDNGDFTYNTSTGEVTIFAEGWYRVDGGFLWNSSTSNEEMQVQVNLNGANMGSQRHGDPSGTTTSQQVSVLIYCVTSDVVDISVRQGTGTSLGQNTAGDATRNYIAVERLT